MEAIKEKIYLSPLSLPKNIESSFITFAGEWCLTPEILEKLYLSNISYKVLPSRLLSREDYQKEADLCFKLYNQYAEVLARLLNKIHKKNYSLRYWKTLLNPFLYQLIASVIDHFYILKNIKKDYSDYIVDIIDLENSSFYDFHTSLGGSSRTFHYMIFSLLVEETNFFPFHKIASDQLNMAIEEIGDGKKISSKRKVEDPFFLIRPFKDLLLGKIEINYCKYLDSNVIALGDQYLKKSDIKKLLSTENTNYPYIYSEELGTDSFLDKNLELRNELSFDESSSLLEKCIESSIQYLLPTCFLENYQSVHGWIENIVPQRTISILNSMNCSGGVILDFFIAHSVENYNSRYIMLCHGGCYGAMEVSVQEKVWDQVSDIYALWSNPTQYTEKKSVIKMPSLRFHKWHDYTHDDSKERNEILFFTTGHYPSRYAYNSIYPYTMDAQYNKWQLQFMKSLDLNLRKDIVVRDYHKASKLSDNEFLQWLNENNIKRKRDLSFEEAIKKSKVAIQTVPQTTYLETIVMNHPTICFWNPDSNIIRKDLSDYYKGLLETGVLHFSPYEAAKHLGDIANNPLDWWNDKLTQEALSEFRKNVCFSLANAIEMWKSFINKDYRGL